uniref:Uncharacterized protein n=1 Tax=Oryza nivara TaxID=4536 RepID=A0A0E0GLY1_ORYNI
MDEKLLDEIQSMEDEVESMDVGSYDGLVGNYLSQRDSTMAVTTSYTKGFGKSSFENRGSNDTCAVPDLISVQYQT